VIDERDLMTHTVVTTPALVFVAEEGGRTAAPGTIGLRSKRVLDRSHGSVHLELSICELAAGGVIAPHVQPFEESFYVLEGTALVTIGSQSYEVKEDDFGIAKMGQGSAWSNPFDEPVLFYRVRAPQPRAEMGYGGVFPTDAVTVPTSGVAVDLLSGPPEKSVGSYHADQLPPPGPIFMKGYRGYGIKNIQMRMMLDGLNDAVHHTMFMVQFNPTGSTAAGATVHYHPFEEAYLIRSGGAEALLDGEVYDLAPGDLAWTSVNGTHGFVNHGAKPVRWIEVQAPMPPESGAFIFPGDWEQLKERVSCLTSD
jgi:mannose-6-phosphate isomerase-like protein (cupin superfamily)